MRTGHIEVRQIDSQHPPQLPFVADQDPVQALRTHGTDPPLGVGIRARGAQRNLHNLYSGTGEHRVEAAGELGVPVTDKEPEQVRPLPHLHQQVPRYLSDPHPGGVRGDPSQVHPTPVHLDEEQHIQPGQGDRLHCEEIRRQRARSLGAKQLHPTGTTSAARRGPETALAQHCSDRGGRHDDTELAGLPHDPHVSPSWVLPRQPQYQIDRRLRQSPPATPGWRDRSTGGPPVPDANAATSPASPGTPATEPEATTGPAPPTASDQSGYIAVERPVDSAPRADDAKPRSRRLGHPATDPTRPGPEAY